MAGRGRSAKPKRMVKKSIKKSVRKPAKKSVKKTVSKKNGRRTSKGKKSVRKSKSKRSQNAPWYKFWGGAEGNNLNYKGRTQDERNAARRKYEGELNHQMQTAMNTSNQLTNKASKAFTKSKRIPENSRNKRTWLNKTRNFLTGRTESKRKAQGRWGNLRKEVLEPAQQKANLRRLNWEGTINNLGRKSRNSRNKTRGENNTVWT